MPNGGQKTGIMPLNYIENPKRLNFISQAGSANRVESKKRLRIRRNLKISLTSSAKGIGRACVSMGSAR